MVQDATCQNRQGAGHHWKAAHPKILILSPSKDEDLAGDDLFVFLEPILRRA